MDTITDLATRMTDWRRHLHAHPGLTLHEEETARFVAARLTELGIPHVTGVGGHGVVATLTRAGSNRAVGLRADMDALPITEATGLPYASTNSGVMHACGHDGHTTALLGASALLAADKSWSGTIHLVFQPAEEGGGGALSMLADGLFDRFPMERVFALHNWPGLVAGSIGVHAGPVMGAGNRLELTVRGQAGHAAMPHATRDAMVGAAHLIVALQTVVARAVDPLQSAVLSLGTIAGGQAANQIADRVVIRGTMRTLDEGVRDYIHDTIRRVAAGVAATHGVEIDVLIRPGMPVTRNTPAEADLVAEAGAAVGLTVRRDLAPSMAGEDFAWFLAERPGAYVWVGNGPIENGIGLHHPQYDFNDAILPGAASLLAEVARRALR